jgi:hypothetical protein
MAARAEPDLEAALLALSAIYRELEAELAVHAPRCELSGRCCDFKGAGHELFATELEVEWARRHAAPERRGLREDSELCPFHVAGRCELRAGRPLGCRVYFCDPRFAAAMPELAERYHRRVVALHEEHGLRYRYARFVRSIREE